MDFDQIWDTLIFGAWLFTAGLAGAVALLLTGYLPQ
jgi:hypothetical protein